MILARTPSSSSRRCGFTIIELLVVMAIIATLIALIAPALGGVKRRGYKTAELNDIKHVGHAWMMYANANDDAALPGYLEQKVQEPRTPDYSRGWGVIYKYPDNTIIPLDGSNITGPWTWRLLSYLSYEHRLVHSYLAEDNPDPFSLVREGKSVAYEPAFGYNALYIGGWWNMVEIDGVYTPRYKFYDHCDTNGAALNIPQGVAQIQRASDMVIFCSSTSFSKTGVATRLPPNTPGHHAVMPPIVGQKGEWMPADGDPFGAVNVLTSGAWVPLARYTNTIAVLCADGHVSDEGYNALYDARKWINSADTTMFKHAECNTVGPGS